MTSSGGGLLQSGYFRNRTVEDGSFNFASGYTVDFGSVDDDDSAVATGDFNNDGVDDRVSASGANVNIEIQDTNVTQGGVFVGESLEQTSFDLSTQSGALSALDSLETNLDLINQIVARIGSSQSRISTSLGVLQVASENTAAAESQIKDADVAFESARLVRLNLLQQASAAILAQANQQPAIALSLLST